MVCVCRLSQQGKAERGGGGWEEVVLDSNCFGRKSTFYGFSRSVLRVRTVNDEIPRSRRKAKIIRHDAPMIQSKKLPRPGHGRRPCCGCCTSRLFVTVVGTVGTPLVQSCSCVTLTLVLSADQCNAHAHARRFSLRTNDNINTR